MDKKKIGSNPRRFRPLKNNSKLRDEAIKSGLISEKDYNVLIDPLKMTFPN